MDVQKKGESSVKDVKSIASTNLLEEEAAKMRRNAQWLRGIGLFLLFLVAVLFAFGGYVFFEAGNITNNDTVSILRAQVIDLNSNLLMEKAATRNAMSLANEVGIKDKELYERVQAIRMELAQVVAENNSDIVELKEKIRVIEAKLEAAEKEYHNSILETIMKEEAGK